MWILFDKDPDNWTKVAVILVTAAVFGSGWVWGRVSAPKDPCPEGFICGPVSENDPFCPQDGDSITFTVDRRVKK